MANPDGDSDIVERINVWVVEDDKEYRSVLARVLNSQADLACPRSFVRAEEAIECFDSDDPPEVLLMDIVLPGISGTEAIGRIKPISPSTTIVILTNYAEDEKILKAICAGASGYLLKTSHPEEIARSIREAMSGGAAMNPQIAKRVFNMFAELAKPKGEYGLTSRERQVLKLMTDGLTKKEIAEPLFISYHTVDTYLKNIYEKLHVHTRTGAVAKVLKEHIL